MISATALEDKCNWITGKKGIPILFPALDITNDGLVLQLALWLVLPGFFSGFQLGSVTLCLVALVALFRKKGDPKPAKQEQKTPAKINAQKYIIRQRDARGRLRHIETVSAPPNKQYLKQFGPGNYCILTSKPKIALWKNITILEAEAKKGEISNIKNNTHEIPIPQPTFKPKVEIGPKFFMRDIKTPKELKKSRRPIKKKSLRIKGGRMIDPPPPPNELYENGVGNNHASEFEMPKQNKKPNIENTGENLRNLDFIRFPQKNKKEKIKKPSCSLCNDASGDHVICEYCGKLYCKGSPRNCYLNHMCENSMPCHSCNRRIKTELVEVNEYCHNTFCSQRCMDLCYKTHEEKLGCEDCPGLDSSGPKEDEENGDEGYEVGTENTEDMEYECTECNTPINDAMTFCPGCGLELIFEQEEETNESDTPDIEVDEIECDDCGTIVYESDKFCPNCGTEFIEEGEEDEAEDDDCDGDCSNCTNYSCEDRCRRRGRCKHCRSYEDCPIHCIELENDCKNWVCKGFNCEDRVLESDEEGDGSEDTEEDESEEDMDGEDSEGDEGWEESDEE